MDSFNDRFSWFFPPKLSFCLKCTCNKKKKKAASCPSGITKLVALLSNCCFQIDLISKSPCLRIIKHYKNTRTGRFVVVVVVVNTKLLCSHGGLKTQVLLLKSLALINTEVKRRILSKSGQRSWLL